ncbi:MAG: FMN-binding protein [Muribaculaceae bacterium]|nr:FMN-binding protein [Muribaculaceae bacterium]
MKFTTRLLSLLLVLVMLAAATIMVNKAIFGYSEDTGDANTARVDSISYLPDGALVIHTATLAGTINGYAGPVPLDITVRDGRIAGVTALENVETPSFFRRASGLLTSWDGLTVAEALDAPVDGVSGATYSSSAIINNVRAGLACYEHVNRRGTPAGSSPKVWIAFAVTLCACIVPLFVKSRIYHNVQLVANIIVLGFWAGMFLDYYLILKYMAEGMALPAGLVAIAMLIAAFVYPLFGRPEHYCNHICPLGSAQQLMAQVCGYKIRMSKGTVKALTTFRRILWFALMVMLWTDCFTVWMDYELFQAFQVRSASWWIIGAAIVVVALSAVVTRPYCRFVCPTGSLFKRAENIDPPIMRKR